MRHGPWAVVVGASDGIGLAFAEELARRGINLVLVARRRALLEDVAGRLPVDVRVATMDAATPDGIAAIAGSPEDIGLVVCNAALGPVGPYLSLTPAELDAMIDLNCRSAAHLAHAFGTRLVARGRGGIVLLGSMAGNQGSALVAHYAATKAYLRVLAEGLWAEWGPLGVDVLASCPGLVRTPTYQRTGAGPAGRLVPAPMEPAAVVRETLAALGNRPVIIPGRWNRLAFAGARLLPRRRLIAAVSARTERMYRTGSRRPAPGAEAGG